MNKYSPFFLKYFFIGFFVCACSKQDLIGVWNTEEHDSSTSFITETNSETSFSDTRGLSTQIEKLEPSDTYEPDDESWKEGLSLVFDFNFDEDDNGMDWYEENSWVWNNKDGTYDVNVIFHEAPSWVGLEYYISRGMRTGGYDLSGAKIIEYRIRVLQAAKGRGALYIQSIDETSSNELWMWYGQYFDLPQNDQWLVYLVVLEELPQDNFNIRDVTKFGFQILAPRTADDQNAEDTFESTPLDEPANVIAQIDYIRIWEEL